MDTTALKTRIDTAQRHIKALRAHLEKHEAMLSASEAELHQIETDAFLTANNVTHLQVNTRLRISESFYKLMAERRYTRQQTDTWYGDEIAIESISPDAGEFRIRNVYNDGMSCSSIGGIPLNVVQDMYNAYQGGAA